jgi:hypothetical protein
MTPKIKTNRCLKRDFNNYYGDKTKEDKMKGLCDMHWKIRNEHKVLKGRDY